MSRKKSTPCTLRYGALMEASDVVNALLDDAPASERRIPKAAEQEAKSRADHPPAAADVVVLTVEQAGFVARLADEMAVQAQRHRHAVNMRLETKNAGDKWQAARSQVRSLLAIADDSPAIEPGREAFLRAADAAGTFPATLLAQPEESEPKCGFIKGDPVDPWRAYLTETRDIAARSSSIGASVVVALIDDLLARGPR